MDLDITARSSLEAKIAFFDRLTDTSDDDDLGPREERDRQRRRDFFRQGRRPPVSQSRERRPRPSIGLDAPRDVSRGISTPLRSDSMEAPVSVKENNTIKDTPVAVTAAKLKLKLGRQSNSTSLSFVEETPVPGMTKAMTGLGRRGKSTSIQTPKRSMSAANMDSPVAQAAFKKRKKGAEPKMRPECEQIFKGFYFFYIPDNDVAATRRLRILKAREYGATWTRDIRSATHIVVDKDLEYKDVEGIVLQACQHPPPKVVHEEYPVECIQFKTLLEPSQPRYYVKGQCDEEAPTASRQTPAHDRYKRSSPLQLKPPQANPRKWDYAPAPSTPSRSDEPSQNNSKPQDNALTDVRSIPQGSNQVCMLSQAAGNSNAAGDGQPVLSRRDGKPGREEAKQTNLESADELANYISVMQKYRNLPLDVEEEMQPSSVTGETMPRSSDEEEADSGSERRRDPFNLSSAKRTVSGRKDIKFEDKFACNKATIKSNSLDGPNKRTVEVLQLMADYYERVGDHWRTMGYRKAISTLKRQDDSITTEEAAFKLPAIGRRLAQKIQEIVSTDRLQRLEHAQKDPDDEPLRLFLKIYGVGSAQAHRWIAQGLRTLQDVRGRANLTTNQRIGIDHYEDLNTKIPRREVEALGACVQRAAARIDPKVQLIIGGSYRRGAESSSDIDLIVSKAKTESSVELLPFLNKLVRRLETDSFLVARLASSRSSEDGSLWHGCCVLPRESRLHDPDKEYRPIWRRIDFLLVPEAEIGAALIYFTGDDIFNRSMRLLASKKGMRLNQRGLYKDERPASGGTTRTNSGDLIEGCNEKKIFEILGVRWREPHERWC